MKKTFALVGCVILGALGTALLLPSRYKAVPPAVAVTAPTNAPTANPPSARASTTNRQVSDIVLESVEALRRMPEPGALRFDNPELIRVLDEVARRERVVRERQAELEVFAARVAAEQSALRGLTQQVAALQLRLERDLDRREADAGKARNRALEETARKWAALPPAQAVRLVTNMPPDEVAGVLAAMPPESASRMVEALGQSGAAGARQMAEVFRILAAPKASQAAKP